MSYDEWRKKVGHRCCSKLKCTFSDFKRTISNIVSVITNNKISLEMLLKTILFNFYKDLHAQVLEETGNGVMVKSD